MAVGISSSKKATLGDISILPDEKIEFRCLHDYKENTIKRLYHADNIDVLHYLLSDKKVCGKINLIYIDPPYNTGGAFETKDFKHAYNDKFTKESYVEFMRARLLLMYKLLADTGSIYVHLDSNMVFHVKILMDEIFGANNFQGMITRKKCKSKNFTRKTFGNISDYILFYTKSESPIWNRPYEEWSNEKILKEYPFIEEGTGRRHKRVPCHAPGTRKGATGGPWRGMMPPEGKHWQYTPDKLDEMDARGEIYWSSNGNPRRKVYLDQSKGVPVQDIWLDYLDVNNQNTCLTGYPTEKNIKLVKRIIEASSNPGDLVLDCFAGSGTTLVAAEELGRQWIGVDIGDEAIKVIQNRFLYGTKPLGDYVHAKEKDKKELSLDLFNDGTAEKKEKKDRNGLNVQYKLFEEL